MENIKEFKKSLVTTLKNRKTIPQTISVKEKYNKIVATGLLLPKDKISRNGILYDWESAVSTCEKIPGLPMMYNHQVEGEQKPVGHYRDSIALEKRPMSGKWQEVWDKTAEDLKTPEGIPGIYYEADINPNSEYADSVTRGDVRKVSIQIIPEDQVKETDEETGESYTRAFIKDYVEASIVPSPGFMETTMAVLAESFNIKKLKKENVEKPKTESEDELKEDHMSVDDVFEVDGKLMKIIEITDDGYVIGYAIDEEQMNTGNAGGASKTMMPGRDEEKEFYPDTELGKELDKDGNIRAERLNTLYESTIKGKYFYNL